MGTPVVSFTFGSNASLDTTQATVAAALAVEFSLRESDYRGGDYFLAIGPGNERVIVQRNEEGEEPAEPSWSGPTIVYVEGTPDPASVMRALVDFECIAQHDWVRD